jgi:L,D-peptidoglycan transpeptidase YkuD (ErfK/YbiS/YcfS/YnhG family)
MIFTAWSDGRFNLAGRLTRCALGRSGVIAADVKREGDGASPLGVWPIRRILYRPDRIAPPKSGLSVQPISIEDGWCDAPDDSAYNRPVKLPYPARTEALWRDDEIYDLIGVLAHNDDPPMPYRGSAIFLHIARPDFRPTAGCIALAEPDLEELLGLAGTGAAIDIRQA